MKSNEKAKMSDRIKALKTASLRVNNHVGLKKILDTYRAFCITKLHEKIKKLEAKDELLAEERKELENKFQAQAEELIQNGTIYSISRSPLENSILKLDGNTSVTIEEKNATPITLSDVLFANNTYLDRAHKAMMMHLEVLNNQRTAINSEFDAYKKNTTGITKLIHPIKHMRMVDSFEERIKVKEAEIQNLRQKVAENRHASSILYGFISPDQMKKITSILKLGNLTHTKAIENKNLKNQINTLSQAIEDIKNPNVHDEKLINLPSFEEFLNSLSRTEKQDLLIDYSLDMFKAHLYNKNISLRFNDGTPGFPVENYVHMGRYEVELLELLKYIDSISEPKIINIQEIGKEIDMSEYTQLNKFMAKQIKHSEDREKNKENDQPNS